MLHILMRLCFFLSCTRARASFGLSRLSRIQLVCIRNAELLAEMQPGAVVCGFSFDALFNQCSVHICPLSYL